MLKSFIRHRPKRLIAVYVEPHQVEVLQAGRQWRAWQVESTDQYPLPEGENVYDFLQRLNLRPRGIKGTTLVLFLPRTYYAFHREHYPASLQDHLEEALTFDWQENTFYEQEHTLHFFGPPVAIDGHVSVPIFALAQNVYEKFHQVLGAAAFQDFAIIPSALGYRSFYSAMAGEQKEGSLELMGRMLDSTRLEVQRFYKGELLDSMILGRRVDSLRLFRENLRCLDSDHNAGNIQIHLICTDGDCERPNGALWNEESIPLALRQVENPLLSYWVKHLFEQDEVQTFNAPLLLKPWKVPKIAWPMLIAAFLFSVFAAYQTYSLDQLEEAVKNAKRQTAQLETQWKPIELLQTRISKFQEDQKTLTQFHSQGYPLLEILNVLTQITPDDTWLNYLSLRTGQLMLRGESKSAIKYLSELSKVEGMSDVKFASPVSRNPSSDMERFNVQLQMDLEKLRKTLETMVVEEADSQAELETAEPASTLEPATAEPKERQPGARELQSGPKETPRGSATPPHGRPMERGLRKGK